MARLNQHHKVAGEQRSVVIVGAGIAGLTAARTLSQLGIQALVLEQESDVGGRCATVRSGTGVFDVGAQYFTVRQPEFRKIADFLLETGAAREWTRVFPSTSGISERESHPRYCGKIGMNGLAAALAREQCVRTGARVKRIREGRACWVVEVEDQDPIIAEVVVFTPPAPVSLRLISDENTWRMGALLLPLTGVSYKPVVAVMAQLNGPSGLPDPGALRVDDSPISWIADNQMKGISPSVPAITIFGTQRFSEKHFDAPPEEAGAMLVTMAAPFLQGKITGYTTRCWQYASPASTLSGLYYLVEGRAPLYFAGDAFAGGLIEGASVSGAAVARAVAARLKMNIQ